MFHFTCVCHQFPRPARAPCFHSPRVFRKFPVPARAPCFHSLRVFRKFPVPARAPCFQSLRVFRKFPRSAPIPCFHPPARVLSFHPPACGGTKGGPSYHSENLSHHFYTEFSAFDDEIFTYIFTNLGQRTLVRNNDLN